MSSLALSSVNVYAGQSVTVSFVLDNQGMTSVESTYRIFLETTAGQTELLSEVLELAGGRHETILKKVTIPLEYSGSARIVVIVQADGDSVPDNNSVSKSIMIQAACSNDANEPNNNILQATSLTSSHTGMICPGDEDWYQVISDESVTINVTFTHANGDLKLTAYSENGTLLSESDTASDIETVELEAGTYYFRVMGVTSDVSNSYSIHLMGE